MTDIEQKALALVNEVSDQHNDAESIYEVHRSVDLRAALCRAIEQHETFKQEVSDAVEDYHYAGRPEIYFGFDHFIIPKPKPDPLVEAMTAAFGEGYEQLEADNLRAMLDARGWEIREKGQ